MPWPPVRHPCVSPSGHEAMDTGAAESNVLGNTAAFPQCGAVSGSSPEKQRRKAGNRSPSTSVSPTIKAKAAVKTSDKDDRKAARSLPPSRDLLPLEPDVLRAVAEALEEAEAQEEELVFRSLIPDTYKRAQRNPLSVLSDVINANASVHTANADGEAAVMHEWSELIVPAVPRETLNFSIDSTTGKPAISQDFIVPATPVIAAPNTLRMRAERANSKGSLKSGQGGKDLGWRVMKKTLGHGNAAAISEKPPTSSSTLVWRADDGPSCDPEDFALAGNCGFTVVVGQPVFLASANANAGQPLVGPRLASAHPGMCHHYTWDGQHCVTSGLGSEHANRCAGQLSVVGAAVDTQICRTVGMPACSKVGSADSQEAVCGAPAVVRGVCTPEVCPFLAEGRKCPFYGNACSNGSLVYHL